MIKNSYLKTLEERNLFQEIKRQSIFGLVLGVLIVAISLINILFVIDANNFIWKILFYIGIIIFSIGFIAPQLLYYLEKVWSGLAKMIGKVIFSVILSVTYFLLFMPIGLLFRKSRENKNYAFWHNSEDVKIDGWINKNVCVKVDHNIKNKRNMFLQFYEVIYFFIEHKQWWLIPLVTFLLIIGLVLFFVQTSVLAPFIYTLF